MATLWKCYHCEQKIAPKAPVCPHCGGTFDAFKRGFMNSNAMRLEAYEREKAGLPPKSGPGCAIPLGLLVGGAAFMVSTFADANTWQTFGTNNAFIKGDVGRLVIHCKQGVGSARSYITFYLDTKSKLTRSKSGFFGLAIYAGDKRLWSGGQRARQQNDIWYVGVDTKGLLPMLKSGSHVVFTDGGKRQLRYSLKGSSKAFTDCFKDSAPPTPSASLSKQDIVGMRTGQSYRQFVKTLPKHFQGERGYPSESSLTYFGGQLQALSWLKYTGSATWRKNTRYVDEAISVGIAPPVMQQRVYRISRTLNYNTLLNGHQAPLFDVAQQALFDKYGQPAWHRLNPRNNNKGEILWVFDAKTGKSLGASYPRTCDQMYRFRGLDRSAFGSAKRFNEAYAKLGGINLDCGIYVHVTYTKYQGYLDYVTVTLVDLPLLHKVMLGTFKNLRTQGDSRAEAQRQKSEQVKPKF